MNTLKRLLKASSNLKLDLSYMYMYLIKVIKYIQHLDKEVLLEKISLRHIRNMNPGATDLFFLISLHRYILWTFRIEWSPLIYVNHLLILLLNLYRSLS